MVLGDHDFILAKRTQEGAPKGRFWGRGESWGRTVQDLLLGENPLVSTKMVHEVRGDSAKVNGQEIPVIVGVGSIAGKAVVSGGAGTVVAA